MANNDILRRIRYISDFSDSKMIAVFGLADHQVTRKQISYLLKKLKIAGHFGGSITGDLYGKCLSEEHVLDKLFPLSYSIITSKRKEHQI